MCRIRIGLTPFLPPLEEKSRFHVIVPSPGTTYIIIMADMHNTHAAHPTIIRREDYRERDWIVPEIALDVQLDPAPSSMKAEMKLMRNGHNSRQHRPDGQ